MNLTEVTNTDKPIILVFGRLCSGKGTYCLSKKYQNYTHITTSDIVKKVSGKHTRGDLQKTADFDVQIADEMITFIKKNKSSIIDGIRQKSIVDKIISTFGNDQIDLIWLDVPSDIRKARFTSRSRDNDDQGFEKAEAGDSALGLDDLEAHYRSMSNIINNYNTQSKK